MRAYNLVWNSLILGLGLKISLEFHSAHFRYKHKHSSGTSSNIRDIGALLSHFLIGYIMCVLSRVYFPAIQSEHVM